MTYMTRFLIASLISYTLHIIKYTGKHIRIAEKANWNTLIDHIILKILLGY